MRRLPLLLFALLALLAIYETASALVAPARVASTDDWAAAAAEVRSGFRPGDLIAFAPAWADQIGRQHLGDLIGLEMAGRADSARYARLWEVSLDGRGAHADEARGAPVQTSRHGRLRVALYTLPPPATILADFTSRFDEARVTQLPAGGRGDEVPCFRDGDGFRCATVRLARRTLEVDYRPRRGILAPVDGALVTRIELPPAPLGARIVGYTGLHDYFSRKNGDGPVDFSVFIDGQRVHQLRHQQAEGWRRFEIDTAKLAGPHSLRFEVSAPSASWRTFGFHAEARQ